MTIVCKIGGSLLTLPDLASRVTEALNTRFGEKCLIIPGGGATADVVREWSRIYQLDEEVAHRLAIASLDFNNRLLMQLIGWQSVSSREDACDLWSRQSLPLLLEMEKFVSAEESRFNCPFEARPDLEHWANQQFASKTANFRSLPHHWDTTSDSLAAWTAIHWPATELVLFKSVPAPTGLSAKQASDASLVDAHFPNLAPRVQRISWCHLRKTPVLIEPWLVSCPQDFD